MDVSIIIRTYNESQYIGDVLKGIHEQDFDGAIEVIIVDSESTDDTLNIVRKYPGVKIYSIKKSEFTFGYALNYGLDRADGVYAVAISGHCTPASNHWLSNLIKPFQDPGVAITYGKQMAHQSTRTSEQMLFRRLYPDSESPSKDDVYANNANSAFRCDVWSEIRFDEVLPGLEDVDFAIKVKNQGWDIRYIPDAAVYHIHLENNAKVFNRFFREEVAMKLIRQKSSFGFFKFVWLCAISINSDFLASLKGFKVVRCWKGVVGYRISQYYAIYLVHNMGKIYKGPFRGMHDFFIRFLTKGSYDLTSIQELNINDCW